MTDIQERLLRFGNDLCEMLGLPFVVVVPETGSGERCVVFDVMRSDIDDEYVLGAMLNTHPEVGDTADWFPSESWSAYEMVKLITQAATIRHNNTLFAEIDLWATSRGLDPRKDYTALRARSDRMAMIDGEIARIAYILCKLAGLLDGFHMAERG